MIAKFLIFKNITNTQDGAEVVVLLSENGELFSADYDFAAADFLKIFKTDLEIGNAVYRNNDTVFYFANAKLNSLPEGWSFEKFGVLNRENCQDYDVIQEAIQKLGYKTDNWVS